MSSQQDTTALDVLDALRAATAEAAPVALATVVDVQGASPARAGFKLLVRADGSWVGNVGGGALEQRVREDAAAALANGQSRLAHYRLTEAGPDALGMLCGGEVIDEPGLQVPHPRFRERAFVLDPLAEVAADLVDPVTGLTVGQLRDRLPPAGAR
jgi:hypothetical protein